MTVPVLSVLLVEDEASRISDWQDAVDNHNADSDNNGFSIETASAKSVVAAKELLVARRFDAVVIDLRLQVEEGIAGHNNHGNDLVKHVLATQPLGIVVYTGQQGEADTEGYECPQVRVMDKGDGLQQVLTWLADNKDVFLKLKGAQAAFSRETARIFFSSIWPRWIHWADAGAAGGSDLTEVVARHVVAHVHDSLLLAGGEETHPEESYFVPPIKGRLDTGDLIKYEERTWIVVTPRCDLANRDKVSSVLLAACEDISADWNPLVAAGSNQAKDKCRKLVQHGHMPKQHFLSPMRDVTGVQRGPWMAQFHDLKAVPAREAFDTLPPLRFASLSPLFVPSLVERFGAYFGRIGTPGFSSN